ncbi:hypothetical protein LXM94_07405 [Rhizobium sp. TRM95111]|uniref:hypothetical protein n=1 Tax=Rhizobium alarense TaxID=2846851 RepID=UPI001F46D557|nr:hypothetical protein [Rhizobium alarense]MCF3639795.1 hypothetical protein [Rhizobium alarense]
MSAPSPRHALFLRAANDDLPAGGAGTQVVEAQALWPAGSGGFALVTPDAGESLLESALTDPAAGIAVGSCRGGAAVQRIDVLLSVVEAKRGLPQRRFHILAFTDGILPAPAAATFRNCSARLAGLVWDWRGLPALLGAERLQTDDGGWTEAPAQLRAATLIAARVAGLPAYALAPALSGAALADHCRRARQDGFSGCATTDPAALPVIAGVFSAG